MCGDFNFDLLKIDSDHVIQHFFNLLCSYGCLPHVLQSTRVTENTATVIDNIFSNNIQDNTISGDILLTLSEHFSQFLSVKREMVDIKKVNIYQPTPIFQVILFVKMFQFKTESILMTMSMIHLVISTQNLKVQSIDMLP